jgi:hypothetical protein
MTAPSSYRLYIDESGDHTYHELENPAKRYLCIVGCLIQHEVYRTTFHPQLENLKQKHFPHSPDEPVILHRNDIINKRGSFWRLRDTEKENSFNEDLLAFLETQDYKIIAVVIDKKVHIERYHEAAFHPYHYCLTTLLERYCGLLHFLNAKGDVLAESRGGVEDKQLKEAYLRIYNAGTHFRSKNFFQDVLTSKEIKLKLKKSNIVGIQIADLLAYPIKQEILFENNRIDKIEDVFGKKICQSIKNKFNAQFYTGKVDGYGKVFIK